MKRKLFILLAILLLAGLPASAQMKRGGQKKEAPKTEQTTKTAKTTKTTKTTGKSSSSKSSGMSQAQKDRIIQQAIDDMVWVEGGKFMMGATSERGSAAFDSETPAHQVTLSGYYIGKYEVTQELWQAVMGKNPSHFTGDFRRPVEMVSWDDCQKFLSKLNQMTGKNFRLPTEAEWEYAARGGNQSRGYKYAGSNNLDAVAWHSGNMTQPVGQKTPNELGLYDMNGNVWEWCQDWFGSYSGGSQTNPTGPSSGSGRVIRGGCWGVMALYFSVSLRSHSAPSIAPKTFGLRLAL